ncbi:HTH-type transcriptional regulator BhcR [Falsiruegeria mediterranea]|uniref:Transcriptional repressor IclR n=1 Tax=Falsiruegeria mediterranea M17 TaxID=1200281 RepID=A0A2R8C6V9_9RHOB|nr:HTH-type transcriptional regulator BhcR [Falsiruegeria mediterranea]SPJ28177.1 Transcriptional repressor IclR [Falsiruegeria mediterranea M17]
MNDPVESTDKRSRGRPRGWHDKTEQNTIKSLDRAIVVLQRLGELGAVTLTDLASDLGQSPATVYRVLVTFQNRELVDFDDRAQLWSVGPGAFLIGATFLRRTSLVERARPILRALMQETGETANLGIERNGEVLFVSQVETHSNIRAFFPPGTVSEMHASGIGKALLAFMAEDRRDAILSVQPLTTYTAQTLTQLDALIEDLRISQGRGYAFDADEKTDGMRCIAAPVFDAFGEPVAGISVSGPTVRVTDEDIEGLAQAVKSAARSLSIAMGASV